MNNFYGGRISLSPAEVKFTQDSVAMCFQNNTEINETLEEIAKRSLSVTSFPSIRVLMIRGDYYSVDNRRLYVFRVLNLLGLLQSIQVKEVDSFERELTTENEGCHVRVRNRKDNNGRWLNVYTYRHCSCNRGRNARLPDWWNSNLNCHVSLVNVRVRRPISHSSRFDSPSWGIRAQQASRQSSIKSVSQQVANSSSPNEENTNSTSSHASVEFLRNYVVEFDDFAEAEPNLHQLYQSQKSLVFKPNTMVDKVTNKQFSKRPVVYQASQSSYATRSTDYDKDFDQEFQQSTSQTPSSFASQSVIDFLDYTMHIKPESSSHTPASISITAVPDTMEIITPCSEPSQSENNYSMGFDMEFKGSVSQSPSSSSRFASKSVIDHFDYPKHTKLESSSHTPASISITAVPDTMVITAPRSEPSPWNHTYPERSNKRQTEEDCDSISEANCFIDLLKTIFCCVPCKNC